jgi:hypothetical protein
MAVRDFDPTQINSDFSAILEQAGIAFTYQGVAVTGIWSSSRDAFADFEDQRRNESKFTDLPSDVEHLGGSAGHADAGAGRHDLLHRARLV